MHTKLLTTGANKDDKKYKSNGTLIRKLENWHRSLPSINVLKKTLRRLLLTKQKIKGQLMNYAEHLNYRITQISGLLLISSLVVACVSQKPIVQDLPAKPIPQAPKQIMVKVVPDSLNKLKMIFSNLPMSEIKK